MTTRAPGRSARGNVLLGLSATLLLASGGLLAYFFVAGASDTGVAEAADQPAAAPSRVDVAALRATSVGLKVDDQSVARTWSQLGLVDDHGTPSIDRDKAVAALRQIKADVDQAPSNARMDLRAHKIYKSKDGRVVDLYGAISALEAAVATGATSIQLPVTELPARVTTKTLGIDDISHVLGHFSTKFSVAEKLRNSNLKLAASHLDGYVLQPGVEFSFNDVVGARTEKEGYKIAHVILGGELVDGEAGGTCQVSTTLHGASFFAGLDIIKGRPHSRPSTYVTMGLDATVVYPVTDLKLRNPYDFPVVISYKVARGEARVEILGKERPYDKVGFEREIVEKDDFDTVTREDDNIPIGYMVVDQLGFPGYKVNRYRKFYRGKKLVKTNKWKLVYRPVTEYVRVGANPDPNLPPPKAHKPHGPHPPPKGIFRLSQ